MSRFVLLQTVDAHLVATPAPTVVAATPLTSTPKFDPVIEFVGVDTDGHFSFAIHPYDPATHNTLLAIHVSLFEKPALNIPADPAEIVKTPNTFTADTSAQISGPVEVDATDAPEGSYSAALVAEFDA